MGVKGWEKIGRPDQRVLITLNGIICRGYVLTNDFNLIYVYFGSDAEGEGARFKIIFIFLRLGSGVGRGVTVVIRDGGGERGPNRILISYCIKVVISTASENKYKKRKRKNIVKSCVLLAAAVGRRNIKT